MQPRTIRLTAWISDDRGRARQYQIKPVPEDKLMSVEARGFWLKQLGGEKPREEKGVDGGYEQGYRVSLMATGKSQCTCMGFMDWGHCKHITGLMAAGLLPRDLVLLIHERTDHLTNSEKVIDGLRQELEKKAKVEALLRKLIGEQELKILELAGQRKSTAPRKAGGGRRKKSCAETSSCSHSEAGSLAGSAS